MIILGVDKKSRNIAYTYDDYENKKLSIELAYKCIITLPQLENGVTIKDHLLIIKDDVTTSFYFFFNDIKSTKDARHQAKVLFAGIKKLFVISETHYKKIKTVNEVVWHNTKNLVNSMSHTMQKIVDYNHLKHEDDKVAYIQGLLIDNSKQEAHDILACSRQLESLSVEYSVMDNFQPGFEIKENQKNWNRIHSLLVQANYIHEQAFYNNGVTVKIHPTQVMIKCDFFTIKSAFSYIFDNCVKYCLVNSEVDVDCAYQMDGSLKIDISMVSVLNTDDEMRNIFLDQTRGMEAEKKGNGSGIGMYVAKRFFDLNDFSVSFIKMNDKVIERDSIKYANNMFVIDIPSRYVRT